MKKKREEGKEGRLKKKRASYEGNENMHRGCGEKGEMRGGEERQREA